MRLIDADEYRKCLIEHMTVPFERAKYDISDDYNKGLYDAARLLNTTPTITPEPHWIPVTEDTLPEEGRIVVVYGEKGTWDYGKYRGYGPNIHYWYWKNKTFKKVYWWMYKEDALPEPFKGVTE